MASRATRLNPWPLGGTNKRRCGGIRRRDRPRSSFRRPHPRSRPAHRRLDGRRARSTAMPRIASGNLSRTNEARDSYPCGPRLGRELLKPNGSASCRISRCITANTLMIPSSPRCESSASRQSRTQSLRCANMGTHESSRKQVASRHLALCRPTSGCTGREPLRCGVASATLLCVAVPAGEPPLR